MKLTPNLWSKKNYVVHYRNLKHYLELGMKVTHIHRILQFNQSSWLKPYIEFNTKKRATCKSNFEKDYYKLMSNSVFGKTQENLRKRVNIELVTNSETLKERMKSPKFVRSMNISTNLTAIQLKKTTIMLNRPIYVGFSVLELSKLHMYNFHYKEMIPKYPTSKMLFTDTDSLTYLLQTDDIYKDMVDDMLHGSQTYDMSDFPDSHVCFNGIDVATIKYLKSINKKVLGKMKDEMKGIAPLEFVGLRPKLYSFLYKKDIHYLINEFDEEEEVETPTKHSFTRHDVLMNDKLAAKGVTTSVKRTHLRHRHYLECQIELSVFNVQQNLFRTRNHTITSASINKIGISGFDTKRWLADDGIHSFAHGHWRTLKGESL